MLDWDYRIVYFPNDNYYEVMEVDYDEKGKPTECCDATAVGLTIEETRKEVAYMERATYLPILEYKNGKLNEIKNKI